MLNKLVHETRGKCWHNLYETMSRNDQGQTLWGCRNCHQMFLEDDDPNPDYQVDMNACRELMSAGGVWRLILDRPNEWYTTYDFGQPQIGPYKTPQLAIIHAYLKSKGVELGEDK